MTIGKKIKYIRNLYHMSSSELAEKTGIHPVTIRKYETDKMLPQQAQIDRIAAAFSLSSAVFGGVTEMKFDFQYGGDLLGLLIMLYVSNGLFVTGKRAPNGALIQSTVKFSLNTILGRFLCFYQKEKGIDINDLTLGIIDDNTLKSFMYWEYMYNRRDDYYEAYLQEESSERLTAYNEVNNDYDEVEIKTLLSGRLNTILNP